MAIDAIARQGHRPVLGSAAAAPAAAPAAGAHGESFGASLSRLVEHGGGQSQQRQCRRRRHARRGSGDVHDAMIALQRADLTLQLTVQVRNKLVQAYQEIMRMPV